MDEEKLNNELKNRIREVFDSYEDTGADEGWILLREKFPVKKKNSSLAWLWYAAAAVVLLILGIWLVPGTNKTKPVVVRVKHPDSYQQSKNNPPAIDTVQQLDYANRVIKTNDDSNGKSESIAASRQTSTAKSASLTGFAPATTKESTITATAVKKDNIIPASVANPSANLVVNNTTAINQLSPDTSRRQTISTQAQTQPLPVVEHQKDIYNLLAESVNDKGKPTKKANHKPVISVYAATYFNYAKGSNNPVNLGGGFTSDFHLTHKLKLSTGLAIAQNRLNYSNGTEPNAQQHEAAFANLAAAVAKANGAPITGNGTKQSLAVFAANMGGTKNYSANLVGLDIPVNLKFEFNPQKTDAYVSAGVSSGTFINETYKEIYTHSQISRESATHNSFSTFNIAKTLNFSFGVGYPLGKSNRLVVEPFLKYPLDGLGQQQIRFGAGGVNLKLNFRSLKE